MKSLVNKKGLSKGEVVVLLPEVYRVNPLVNDIQDLDKFRGNVEMVDISLQKMGGGDNAIFCMRGNLFDGSSQIKSATIFHLDF
jgi:hypothetical protein